MRKDIRFALPMPAFKPKDWKTIGENIFNSREQNEPSRRIKNHK